MQVLFHNACIALEVFLGFQIGYYVVVATKAIFKVFKNR